VEALDDTLWCRSGQDFVINFDDVGIHVERRIGGARQAYRVADAACVRGPVRDLASFDHVVCLTSRQRESGDRLPVLDARPVQNVAHDFGRELIHGGSDTERLVSGREIQLVDVEISIRAGVVTGEQVERSRARESQGDGSSVRADADVLPRSGASRSLAILFTCPLCGSRPASDVAPASSVISSSTFVPS